MIHDLSEIVILKHNALLQLLYMTTFTIKIGFKIIFDCLKKKKLFIICSRYFTVHLF